MNNRKVIKAGIAYTICNFISKGLFFLTTPIFTRIMSKNDFGLYNDFISVQGILVILISLNLEASLISAKYKFQEEFDNYVLSMVVLSVISNTCWLVLFILTSDFWGYLVGIEEKYLLFIFIYLFSYPIVNLFISRSQLFFKYWESIIVILSTSFFSTFLSWQLVLTMKNHIYARIFGVVIPYSIVGVVLFITMAIKGKKVSLSYWKYAIPICVPFIPHLLSMTMLNMIDRVMITKWCGAEQNAIYSLAYTCGAIVTILLSSVNGAFAPWLGEQIHQKSIDNIKTVSKYYIIIFMYMVILVILMAPDILLFMGGDTYKDAVYVIVPILIGCSFQFLYTLFVNVEQFLGKTKMMALASIVAAFTNFVLNYIFIPQFGYKAAAYTTLIGYFVLLVLHMIIVYCMKMSYIYSYKFVIMVIALAFIIMCICLFLYQYALLRYICLSLMIGFGVLTIINQSESIIIFVKKWRNDNV